MPAPADPRYPTPPELSPEETARRRAITRRWGLAIAVVCIVLAAITLVVLLAFEPS